MSWSGGKDSALALYELRRDPRYEVVGLLTTIAAEYGRISHHGVREALLELQAAAIGAPLDKLYLSSNSGRPCTNEEYEELMGEKLRTYRRRGVSLVAHGDIFLEDLRAYREQNLAQLEMRGLFPLWRSDTTELVHRFAKLGFRAVLVCVDGQKLQSNFLGREIDAALLHDLPPGVDPCGENGEYHSFVFDGPIFERPVPLQVGEIVERDTRYFADLLLPSAGTDFDRGRLATVSPDHRELAQSAIGNDFKISGAQ